MDPSAIPAGVPPDQYAEWLQQQRQAMIANVLTQSSLAPLDSPQTRDVHGIYVQPRIGGVSVAAKLADALLGRHATDVSIKQNADLQQQMNQAYVPAPAGQPPNPRNPWGQPADVVRRMANSDPKSYAEYLRGTPAWQDALQAAGGDAAKAQQIMHAKAEKEAQINVRGGESVSNPIGGVNGAAPAPITPDVQLGAQFGQGPNGVTAAPITGSAPIAADKAGQVSAAETANKVAQTPATYQTQGGGTSAPQYPGQGQVPLPPALLAAPGPGGPPAAPGLLPPPGPPGAPPAPAQAPPAAAAGGAQASATTPAPTGGPKRGVPTPAVVVATSPAGKATPNYWAGMPVYNAPSNTALGGQGTESKATSDAVVKAHTDNLEKFGTQSTSAMTAMHSNSLMLPHLANSSTGTGADEISAARSFLSRTGMLPQDQIDKLSDTEIAGKYLNRNGTEGLLARYGRVTQGEVNLAVNKQAPNLTQNQQSILKLTIADDVNSAYIRQRADDYNAYKAKGGDPRSYDNWYSKAHPIEEFQRTHAADIAAHDIALYKQGGGNAAPGAAPTGVHRISNDAEFDALPAGAHFVGPDGVPRTKPGA